MALRLKLAFNLPSSATANAIRLRHNFGIIFLVAVHEHRCHARAILRHVDPASEEAPTKDADRLNEQQYHKPDLQLVPHLLSTWLQVADHAFRRRVREANPKNRALPARPDLHILGGGYSHFSSPAGTLEVQHRLRLRARPGRGSAPPFAATEAATITSSSIAPIPIEAFRPLVDMATAVHSPPRSQLQHARACAAIRWEPSRSFRRRPRVLQEQHHGPRGEDCAEKADDQRA
eukprot:CAMPEP_0117573272 /NCGR_PEP_ID=MMETSP0784-20121206/60858_1 /TAXON_ID=39447 /ORGANISM="" /LENGTH=232 /DNA_ID=CAMNT_0005371811 /DNA_START=50 /DNA_END=748 /DNA_ORIENTATION=-